MENALLQRLRYAASKFSIKIHRVKDGYKFFDTDMEPVSNVDGVACGGILPLADVQSVIADLVAKMARAKLQGVHAR